MIVSTTRLIVMIQEEEYLSLNSTELSFPFSSPSSRVAFFAVTLTFGSVLSLLSRDQPKKDVCGSTLSRATAAAIINTGRTGNINRSSWDSQDERNVGREYVKQLKMVYFEWKWSHLMGKDLFWMKVISFDGKRSLLMEAASIDKIWNFWNDYHQRGIDYEMSDVMGNTLCGKKLYKAT